MTQCKISHFMKSSNVIVMGWHNTMVIQQPATFQNVQQTSYKICCRYIYIPYMFIYIYIYKYKYTDTLQEKTWLIKNSLMINEPYNCSSTSYIHMKQIILWKTQKRKCNAFDITHQRERESFQAVQIFLSLAISHRHGARSQMSHIGRGPKNDSHVNV
jgi:hypothetical protein